MASLKEILKKSGKFSQDESKILPRSFDIIGNTALIQIPHELESKKKIIANAILKNNKNVDSVYGKGKHKGRLRKQTITWIAGKKIEEVLHKESGCKFKLNIKTCYFTPRLGTDRLEIASKIKKKEKILVMFAGVGPYGIILAKKNPRVTCIELGKEACKYMEENCKLNKISMKVIQGDVKRICPKLKEKYDRILMPRPQLKDSFLKEAFMLAKKGTIIHFYDFVQNRDLLELKKILKKKMENTAKKLKKKIKIIQIKKIRELAPYKYNMRIDFKII